MNSSPAFISLPVPSASASSTSHTYKSSALTCSSFIKPSLSQTQLFSERRRQQLQQRSVNPNPSVILNNSVHANGISSELNPSIDSTHHSADEKRTVIRIGMPSKGGILEDTKQLLAEVGINVQIKNPRQYVASLKGLDAEVWLQRPADIVRKVRDGDIDLGFTGYDLVAEYGGQMNSIIAVHERLAFGECRLSVGVPMGWDDCYSMADLKNVSLKNTLRIATKYKNETERFMKKHEIENYKVVNMDGALEASTQMGTADCIIDLVSSGTTLRENLLREIDDGILLNSSMQLIGNRDRLSEDSVFGKKLRNLTKEVLERIEAHLLGKNNFNIIANIRGSSMVDVSRRLATYNNLRGVDGPTISPVVPSADSDDGMYAISIVVPKDRLYSAIQQLRTVGGSGVTVMPVSFIFPQNCTRWETLTESLGVSDTEETGNVTNSNGTPVTVSTSSS